MREEIYTLSGNFMLKIAKKSCFSTKKLKKKKSRSKKNSIIKKKISIKNKKISIKKKNYQLKNIL